MKTLTDFEFRLACVEQANSFAETVVVCPACKTLQMGQEFLDAGLSYDMARGMFGINCIGRYTGATSPRKQPDGKPCDWTLGGLLQIHKLEVATPDGQTHPHFQLASINDAHAFRASRPKTGE